MSDNLIGYQQRMDAAYILVELQYSYKHITSMCVLEIIFIKYIYGLLKQTVC